MDIAWAYSAWRVSAVFYGDYVDSCVCRGDDVVVLGVSKKGSLSDTWNVGLSALSDAWGILSVSDTLSLNRRGYVEKSERGRKMQDFFEIARTDFAAAFAGAWLFPLLLVSILWIFLKEKDKMKKLLLCGVPLLFLFVYWCPFTGILFMKLLGQNVYWRLLWLILLAVVIPYAVCILLKGLSDIQRQVAFVVLMGVLALAGKPVLSKEWFEPSTNVYKLPQNVIEVCELLPSNIHALVSNRLMPYIRQCDPTITLEYGRNSLVYNGITETEKEEQILYLEVQKSEIDLAVLAPLAKKQGCTFLVFSSNRTYIGNWKDYGYKEYASTDEFCIFVDLDYKEGQDTRKWEE